MCLLALTKMVGTYQRKQDQHWTENNVQFALLDTLQRQLPLQVRTNEFGVPKRPLFNKKSGTLFISYG